MSVIIEVAEKWFNYIKNGKKIVEGRPKISSIIPELKEGIILRFKNGDDYVNRKYIGMEVYDSWREYLESEGLDRCLPDVQTIEEGVNIYKSFGVKYKNCDKVVAIRFI